MKLRFDRWDALMAVLAGLHILLAPYTKVEESFNIQAMHDLLFHQDSLHKYDHFEFPGVVPRTFLGPIAVSAVSYPFLIAIKFLELPKIYALYTVRFVLGAFVLGTLYRLRQAVSREFGLVASRYFAVLTIAQFHLLFYCSRPLPNIFALALVDLAFSSWLSGSAASTLRYLVIAASVFRCDVILLLATVGVMLLWTRSISFWTAVKSSAITAVVSVGLSVAVDSIFWQRWIWPEFEVFWFNSVLNRSSEWGISPFHWYFTSALPRAMMAALPLAVLGLILERRTRKYVLSVLLFIVIYSKLPHKELRFILIVVPVLNMSGAVAMAQLHNKLKKPSYFSRVMYSFILCMLMASFGISVLMAVASYANYPGGHALQLLHFKGKVSGEFPGHVHIDVLPAMTGVSRFCEMPYWSYSKEENLSLDAYSSRNFTHLLNAKDSIPGFDCLEAVPGFTKLKLQKPFPQVLIMKEPKVFIHRAEYLGRDENVPWQGCYTEMTGFGKS
ncbi:hypothetical protein R1flu_015155 [Riccia fluitans]|uniref:Mannosyltransferase n=1 Tax=Riccia fluitans TaxID=41844 RepID=A0ABD1YI45_9MARC